MTKNKFFRNAIGRPEIQSLLKKIYDTKADAVDFTVARSYSRSVGFDLRDDEIARLVKSAAGEDLDIVFGTYAGEIPKDDESTID